MTRSPKMTPAELAAIADVIEVALNKARQEIGPFGTPDYWDIRRTIFAALTADLEARVSARIDSQYDGCRVRIGGLASSSTSGIEGALSNWIAAARRKAAT